MSDILDAVTTTITLEFTTSTGAITLDYSKTTE